MTRSFKKFEVNGTVLNVLIAGQGEPVLLIHGFPDDHSVWRHQIDALVQAGFQVIAPDMRGYGESALSKRVRDYHVSNLVKDLVALLDALNIKQLAVAGHDWGAGIGWMLAIHYPDRVTRYAALSVGHPCAFVSAPMSQKLRSWYMLFFQLRGLAEFLIKANNWTLFRKVFGLPNYEEEVIQRLSRPGRLTAGLNYYRANVDMLFVKNLPPVKMPVLGLFSTGDKYLIEQQMQDSAQYVQAEWRYECIEGVSHWLQLDAPERVSALLIEFFGKAKL